MASSLYIRDGRREWAVHFSFVHLSANVLNRCYYTKERERIADTRRKRKGDALFALEREMSTDHLRVFLC